MLSYDLDENIYYADDCEFFHLVLSELTDYYNFQFKINSIIPKNEGLNEVNKIIEAMTINPSKTRKKYD